MKLYLQELAALEAEAEALALQAQQHETVSHNAAMDLSRYSVSLADESRSADRAMVRNSTSLVMRKACKLTVVEACRACPST